jgi:hypothetical protein
MVPNTYDLLDPKPPTQMFKTMDELFRAMLRFQWGHPGTVFELADREEERCVGFWDPTSGSSWHIHVDDLKRERAHGDRRVNLVWLTRQRRMILAERLSLAHVPIRDSSTISVADPPEGA